MGRAKGNKTRATLEDIRDIATGLPEVVAEGRWGEKPSYSVYGKTFVFFREPRKDAIDPDTGERMDDVVAIHTPTEEDKLALVSDEGNPFFTTPHWNGYKAVLIRERDIGEVPRDELAEIITDAWLARAPKRVAKAYLDDSA